MINQLLSAGADWSRKITFRSLTTHPFQIPSITTLMLTAQSGAVEAVASLLNFVRAHSEEREIDFKEWINSKDEFGLTVLHRVFLSDTPSAAHQVISYLLLIEGINIEAKDAESLWTPLMFACKMGDEKSVEVLVRNGANVSQTDRKGRTPLDIAIQSGKGFLFFYLPSELDKEDLSNVDLSQSPIESDEENV